MASKNHDKKGDIGAPAGDMLNPGGAGESPIKELKASILALEWEITEETINQFQQQIDQLEEVWQKDAACVLQLRILRGLGRHVEQAKADVHPETLNLIFSVFNNLERIAFEDLSKVEKQEVANQDLKRYEALRQRLGDGKAATAAPAEPMQPETRVSAALAGAPAMSADATPAGFAGASVQPALSHAADGVPGSSESRQWKDVETFKEVDDRLDEFFGGDDASEALASMEPALQQAGGVDGPVGNAMPDTIAGAGGFTQEVGDRLDEFFGDEQGLAPPAGGIREGELPMTFDAPAAPAAPAAMAPGGGPSAPPVKQEVLPPLNPAETPIKGLKYLVQSLGTHVDNETMDKLTREIQAFGGTCQAEPGLQVLLTLLSSTGKTSRMLGKQTIPGSMELFRSLYASLEELYASRTPTNGRACEELASQAMLYTELQNKVLYFLVSTIVKKEKQIQAERKSAAMLKQQVGQTKAALATAREQMEKGAAAEQEVTTQLRKQLALEQMDKEKALQELEALRQDMARQDAAAASVGFFGKLRKLFGGR